MSQCIRCGKVIILRAFHLVFQQAEQSGAYKSKDKVHYHSDGKGFEISVISSSYAFCCVEKFYNSNNGKNAGILDIDDQVVANLRHDVAQCLWKDYVHHSLYMRHSDCFCSFCLTFVNRKDSASDGFCHVGSGIDRYYEKCRKPHGHVDIEQVSTSVIDKHGLYHHWGAAEKFHVACHNKFEKSNQCLFNGGVPFIYRNCLNNSNYKANKAP